MGLAMITTQGGQPKPGIISDSPEVPTIKHLSPHFTPTIVKGCRHVLTLRVWHS
jgi:hypothetical protein